MGFMKKEARKTNKLRGAVAAKYGSTRKLAPVVGWCYSKTYRLVMGRQAPTAQEINALAEALDITAPEEIVETFLRPWQKR